MPAKTAAKKELPSLMVLQRVQEWGIRELGSLARRFGRRSALPKHLETGLEGEQEAFFHLRRQGYLVVARRWTSARVRGDLDLIAWHGGTLCFIEVKSRTAHDKVTAETAVDRSKRAQLRQLARVYLAGFAEPQRTAIASRFDVVSIYLLPSRTECEILENAFGWHERSRDAW